jgi:hypothetical protein
MNLRCFKEHITSEVVRARMADTNGMGAETCVAQGSLLLMTDRHFVTDRVIRRGYCVPFDENQYPLFCNDHHTNRPHGHPHGLDSKKHMKQDGLSIRLYA